MVKQLKKYNFKKNTTASTLEKLVDELFVTYITVNISFRLVEVDKGDILRTLDAFEASGVEMLVDSIHNGACNLLAAIGADFLLKNQIS